MAAALAVLLGAQLAVAQEGQFIAPDRAPAAVFPDADRFESSLVDSTPSFAQALLARLGVVTLSTLDPQYPVARAYRGEQWLGTAVVVEEIGKHRPITFVVGVRPDGAVEDVAVMAYREAYGSDVRQPRFLGQYRDKGPADDLRPYHGIANVAGATLSVEAASRAVREAQAVVGVLGETSR